VINEFGETEIKQHAQRKDTLLQKKKKKKDTQIGVFVGYGEQRMHEGGQMA
jgi:hypothetical protein